MNANTRSFSEDYAALETIGRRFDDDAARALVAALIQGWCGRQPDESGSVWRRKGNEYVDRVSLSFGADGGGDLGFHDTAVDFLLPDEGGLEADGCEAVAVVINGKRHRPEDLNGLEVAPARRR